MSAPATRSELRAGLAFGMAAYGFWAFAFPLHLRLLDATTPAEIVSAQPAWALEVLCQRVVWSLCLCLCLIPLRRRGADLRRLLGQPRTVGLLAVTALLVTVNWLVFIYATSTGQLYRAGIGYFVTPIVQIVLGTIFLHERLRRFQWAAVACATSGIAWLFVVGGALPWIELTLAVSFGFYGLLRKRTRAGPIVGLTVETAVLTPVAIGYLVWAARSPAVHLGVVEGSAATVTLLALTGVSTALPLMWFAAAAARLPLSTVGFLQFSAPTGQFLLGMVAFGERPVDARMWLGYALIWLGVLALVAELLRTRHLARRALAAS